MGTIANLYSHLEYNAKVISITRKNALLLKLKISQLRQRPQKQNPQVMKQQTSPHRKSVAEKRKTMPLRIRHNPQRSDYII